MPCSRRIIASAIGIGLLYAGQVLASKPEDDLSAIDRAVVAGSVVPPGTDHAHATREISAYDDLVQGYPTLTLEELTSKYFKDAHFGPQGPVERRYSPKPSVTILRDAEWGIPYIYGDTDADAWFGAGYVTAEDRLAIMELLRRLGKAEVFELVGTGPAWLADAEFARIYGYTDAELEAMGRRSWETLEDPEEAAVMQTAMTSYVEGINAYIQRIHSGLTPAPAAFTNAGLLPAYWTLGDVVAATTLVRALFGAGGGAELTNAAFLQDLIAEFGIDDGKAIYEDLRNRFNLDGPVHTTKSFPYNIPNPDVDPLTAPGNVMNFVAGETGLQGIVSNAWNRFLAMMGAGNAQSARGGGLQELAQKARIRWERIDLATAFGDFRLPRGGGGMSNALVIGGSRSASGQPVLVGGPQAAYFSPEILFEYEMHGETVHTRGGGFPGLGIGPVVGRATGYAWSPTAGNGDMIDTRINRLCEPDGSAPGEQSRHYLRDGQCLPMERRLIRSAAGLTDGMIDLQGVPLTEITDIVAERTVYGPVIARGQVDGEPVVVSRQRSTFMKEADGAVTLVRLVRGQADTPEKFFEAFHNMNLSSNWMYINGADIAYWHAGLYPLRPDNIDADFPTWGEPAYDWLGLMDPAEHPHEANPKRDFIVSWNNRIAPDWNMQDVKFGFGSLYRADMLEDRILAEQDPIDAVRLTQLMQEAGLTDFRASHVLPVVLEVLDHAQAPSARAEQMRQLLQAWVEDPAFAALRRDGDEDGYYDNGATAIMDAWWGPLIEAIFNPVLGDVSRVPLAFDNAPGPLGSAYQDGFYGQVWTDLAQLLGKDVRTTTSRIYCGQGDLGICAAALWASLDAAGNSIAQQQGEDPTAWRTNGEAERIRFVPAAALSMHWNNRPTYQEVYEFLPPGKPGNGRRPATPPGRP